MRIRGSSAPLDVDPLGTNDRTVLVYLPGSLGEVVIALPLVHLVARRFPTARRILVTNAPIDARGVPVEDVLNPTGLLHGVQRLPLGFRTPRALIDSSRALRALHADVLVYLAPPRNLGVTLRNAAFFRASGVRHIIGLPLRSNLRSWQFRPERGRWESETERLARAVAALGDARLDDPESWGLVLSETERGEAARHLRHAGLGEHFLAFSIGGKFDAKDWGDDRWTETLRALNGTFPQIGLAVLGAPAERERSERLRALWSGPSANLCGVTDPRISAAVMERAVVFLGHDSGPMHLAAAVGTPACAVFSARALPGIWYPAGQNHRVFFNHTPCADCQLETCVTEGKRCLREISAPAVVTVVVAEIRRALGGRAPDTHRPSARP